MLVNGIAFLAWRLPDGPLRARLRRLGSRVAVPVAAVVVVVLLLWYVKEPASVHNPALATALALGIAGAVTVAGIALRRGRPGLAFAAGLVANALPVITVGLALFPDVLASTVQPAATVSVDSAAAGGDTLRMLTYGAAPLLPVLLAVQASCWWLFRRRDRQPAPLYW